MRLITLLRLRLRSLFSRKAVEDELAEEMRYHLERQIDEEIASGTVPEEARYAALRSIKDLEQRKEDCRDMRRVNWIENARRDVWCAVRSLRREPAFALTSIGSLALAIGMATAVFTAVNSVLLRPLDLPQSDRLALLWGIERGGEMRGVVSFADFEDWRRNSHAFESAAVYNSFYKPSLTGVNRAERLLGLRVSHEYFKTLGARLVLGRFFTPEEDWDGSDNVVVLSNSFWRDHFQANPQIVGQKIFLDGRPETVVGVAAAGTKSLPRSLGGQPPQVYRPVGELRGEKSRDGRHLQTIVRLKPGITIAQAQAELNVLCRNMERLHPEEDAKLAVRIVGIKDDLTRNLRDGLIGLQLAVLAVLLIACANIANLSLARWSNRRREIAIRAALGAGVWRLVRMLLVESLLIGISGGITGLGLALWGGAALKTITARALPDAIDFSLDARVFVFAALLSMGTGLLFGMAPIWQILASRIENSLKDGGRGVVGRRKQTLRHLLAAGQIATALVLLISAGLLTHSFLRLQAANPGFDPRGVLTAGISLPSIRYQTDRSRADLFRRLLAKLRALPGVSYAALVTPLPLSGDFDKTGIEIMGRKMAAGEQDSPDRYVVSPDYFRAVKIPLLQGRLFDNRDDADHDNVALISQTAARRFWPGDSPIGKKVRAGSASGNFIDSPYREIVGVVGDVEQYRLGMSPTPQIYMPHAQFPDGAVTLVLRISGDPLQLAEPLRRSVIALDAEQPLYDVLPLASLVDDSIAPRRLAVWVLGGFAFCAFALAVGGIYGVISYTVAQRTQEFGIRMAVGARPIDILKEAIASGFPTILTGIIVGFGAALAVKELLGSFLFGISSMDPANFAGVPLALIIVALIACYLPARQAARLDPITTLRQS